LALLSVLTGIFYARQIEKRIRVTDFFIMLIKEIKIRIAYSRQPLVNIISDVMTQTDNGNSEFLKLVLSQTGQGMSFADSWSRALVKCGEMSCLKSEDRTLLNSFASKLGTSYADGQIQTCETYTELLTQRNRLLKEKSVNQIKVTQSMGALVGALILIFFC